MRPLQLHSRSCLRSLSVVHSAQCLSQLCSLRCSSSVGRLSPCSRGLCSLLSLCDRGLCSMLSLQELSLCCPLPRVGYLCCLHCLSTRLARSLQCLFELGHP